MVPRTFSRLAVVGLAICATVLIGARSYSLVVSPKGDRLAEVNTCLGVSGDACNATLRHHFMTGVLSSGQGLTVAVRVPL